MIKFKENIRKQQESEKVLRRSIVTPLQQQQQQTHQLHQHASFNDAAKCKAQKIEI